MKDKSQLFNQLPNDCKKEIGSYLPTPCLFKTAMTSKTHWNLFYTKNVKQPGLLDERKKIIGLLLGHVVNGEHEKVVSMLEKDISLLYISGEVIDCSERQFIGNDSISAIEYAFWALDKHMWSAMLGCVLKLKDEEQINEVFEIVSSLYDKVNTKGVSYTLNNKQITNEKHYDFAIIKELQKLIDYLNAPKKVWVAIEEQWRKGVGGAQKLLVMHGVYEYCSTMPFEPLPEFTAKPQSLKKFENCLNNENWFCTGSKLGLDFAIVKVGFRRAIAIHDGMEVRWCAWADLEALTALCEIRTNDFTNLKQQLETQMTIDTDRQIFQL